MAANIDVASYHITKHSWKGKYKRIFSIGTMGLVTYNPANMDITNQWPYSEVVSVAPFQKSTITNEFIVNWKKGKKTETMKFSSDHRAEIITAAMRHREKFVESNIKPLVLNAVKHHWSDFKVPTLLEVGFVSLNQRNPRTNSFMCNYDYKDMEGLVTISDSPGSFAVVHGGFGRIHLFTVENRDEIMKKIKEHAWLYVGVRIKTATDSYTLDACCNIRFGKYSTDEFITSISEFLVHKIALKHSDPVKRKLCITECCLLERDPGTYSIVTLKPLSEISALIRNSENPQMFTIEYVKGQIRMYTSTERDTLLASLLDGVRASGNRDVHVKMTPSDRGKRLGPATIPVDEEVESSHLKFLQAPPVGWDFIEAVFRFNNNIPYSGLLHSVTQDGIFSENKDKLIQGALISLMSKEGDQNLISNKALEAQFQALRRLVASKIGYACFLQLPNFREKLGTKVVKALKRMDEGVAHAAIDMICALMQPMHDDYDLRQEQLNKSSLLSNKPFLESLLSMTVEHIKSGTGALVVTSMLDFLTFSLCVPYSETTDGTHFDTLLNLVALHGRSLFQLFQHPSLAIVKGAGLVMKAVIEEGDSDISVKMQDLALAEGALPRHFHIAMFTQSTDNRLMAMQQLSRQLVSLWVTGHQTSMGLLKRTVPPGLLSFLDSEENVPVNSRDLINTRDNLKLAQDLNAKNNQKRNIPSLIVLEKQLDLVLQHWRSRMGIKNKNEKMQQPVALRRRRARIKSDANWAYFYYQFHQDHARPDLIWNFKTREELRDCLENEMRGFTVDRDLCQNAVIAWNHTEFEVSYHSLHEEIKIGDYYLRLLLEEDNNDNSENSYIKRSFEFFNDLYHRFLLASNINMRSMCLQAMAIVYSRHHEDIGPFNDTRYIISILEKSVDRLERDRLLVFISKLILNKKNVAETIDSGGLRILVDLLTLAHLHTSRATVPLQSNVIEASPEMIRDSSEKEWYYGSLEKNEPRLGPFSFIEMKDLWTEGSLNRKSKCWAQGMDGWRQVHSVPQLKWSMLATGAPLFNESELALLVLNMLIQICDFYPSRDKEGSIIRPLPKAKRMLSDSTCLNHIVQLLLTFDPSLVEKVSVLLTMVMQDNPSMPKLYLTGFFFFILMYTGSNVLPLGKLLKATHALQAFRSEDNSSSPLMTRSILGQILPEAMVCYLENHGPEKFAEIFLGEFDTPEAIWNSEMRRMMIEKIAAHICDFTPRLRSNTRALYQYCPIPVIQYPQLDSELFCNIYYLRHLCDTTLFPNWPIREPVQLLRNVLEAWKMEVEKKPPPLSLADAYTVLGLNIEDKIDEAVIRKTYFRLAQKYHPDKNPEGREIFEEVNKAYEFLCSKSSKSCNGPDPHNIILILKTQSILFSRYTEELHPYKYAGYPMLVKTIAMETKDELLFSKEAAVLPAATETAFYTVNCSALNAEELRREGGLQLLRDAYSRCMGVLSRASKMDDVAVQVCLHVTRCFTVAAQFAACRERLAEMLDVINDLCRILFYQHLSKLCLYAVECVSALAVDSILQNHLFQSGVLFHLLLCLFNYDYTLEEGGVERCESSNQQEINNQFAKLSIRACSRLMGRADNGDSTPENGMIFNALQALLTPYITKLLGKTPEQDVLKLLNSNSENPYLIWNNGTRAELMEYLKIQQKERIRSGECDASYGADFVFSAHSDELYIGEIFVRVYNAQPTFPLENPKMFALHLLDYLSSQAQYLYSLMSLKDVGMPVGGNADRLTKIEMALEALRNVIRSNPGTETQCIGQFKLLFSLLRLDGCSRVQVLTVDVISGVTSNQECVNNIAESEILVYLLLVLKSLPSSLNQLVVLETMLPLMSNSKLVKEAMMRGAAIYLLDLFCNSPNPQVREQTAELLAKMTSDKLVGPKMKITLSTFLPLIFLDAMKDSPPASVQLFEVTQENPELIWNDESRQRLSTTIKELAEEHYVVQKDNPTISWKPPEDLCLGAGNLQGEVVVAGVFLRLFIQNPGWVLRRPREFLIELLDNAHEQLAKNKPNDELLETTSCAIVCLLQTQSNLLEQIPGLGHIPRLVQAFLEPADNTACKAWIQIIHELANSQSCVKVLCKTNCLACLMKAMQKKPDMMMLACETVNRIFTHPIEDLVQQAVESRMVQFLLRVLEGHMDGIANPAAAKAQVVNALKAMCQSLSYGQLVTTILDDSTIWAEYRDQKHDLFIAPAATSGYLTGTANIAGYLTQGSGNYMPSIPPPMEE